MTDLERKLLARLEATVKALEQADRMYHDCVDDIAAYRMPVWARRIEDARGLIADVKHAARMGRI